MLFTSLTAWGGGGPHPSVKQVEEDVLPHDIGPESTLRFLVSIPTLKSILKNDC